MNADQRRWIVATLTNCLVMACCLNVQAEDVLFELHDLPALELRDKLNDVPEPILQWGFPMSAKYVGKIGSKNPEMIFGGFSR